MSNATYQLLDPSSGTLLAETDNLREIAKVVDSFVDDDGLNILDSLMLSDASEGVAPAYNLTGQQIMEFLQERLARRVYGVIQEDDEEAVEALEASRNRRRWLLRVMGLANGTFQMDQTRAIKAAFLLQEKFGEWTNLNYRFTAYNYGPWDAQVKDDLHALTQEGCVRMTPTGGNTILYSLTPWGQKRSADLVAELDFDQMAATQQISYFVTSLSWSKLVQSIYDDYPEQKANSIF